MASSSGSAPPEREAAGGGPANGTAPLAGVRVADLSRVLAGPYCTMVLADLGADVVKVERPGGGDETRSWGPPFAGGEAAYYLSVNRNKRSCALDLSVEEGRALALELCARADIVIENFKVGGADRLGVGYEQVRERNPRVVYCSITGFGSERTPPGRPGYDFVAQAETGLMSITGPEDGPPYKVGVALVDVLTGLHAAAAVLGALHGGEGARIEVPLLDSGLAGLVNVAQNALVTGREPERHGNAHPNIVPYQDFQTASGRIAVAAANDGLFRSLCSVLGLPELPDDDRFGTNAARVEHRTELIPLLEERLAERAAEEWLPALDSAGVPAGKVRSVPDALAAAAAAGRPATHTVDHPTAGALDLVASPIWGATRRDPTPPPLLGQHTAEVLGELGRSNEEVEELAARGVVGLAR
jgi:crotonobetainyl-CoA:carnitine CoA-transferase CaiB-like acyl-CoA transferase